MPLQPAVDRVPQTDLTAIINSAARRHGIDPEILRAVGMQETGLGTSSVYDPVHGTSRTPGNLGHGIWQLDPASGASQADLMRAAKDPAFAADRAASMLSGYIKQHNGDLRAALEAYNGGGKGYADSVLAYMPRSRRGHLDLLADTAPPLPKGATPIQGAPPLPKGAQPLGQTNDGPPLPKGATPIGSRPARRQASIWDRAKSFGQGVENTVGPPLMHGAHMVANAVDEPLQLLNAVLGAPQRFVAGAVAADARTGGPQRGFITDPKVRNQEIAEFKTGIQSVLHPNDPSYEQQAEQQAHIPHSTDPRFRGKLQNFAADLGFQTLTDPLTYVPVAGAGEKILKGAAGLADRGLRSDSKFAQTLAGTFTPHAAERLAFTPKGKAAVVGIRNSEDLNAQRMAHEDEQLLKQHKAEIAQGKVPDAVRQRLLREAYVYGNLKMRRQALQYGYKPTAEEAAQAPKGVLNYTLRDEYFPHVGKYQLPPEYQEVGKAYKRKPNARFEQHQTSNEIPDDPFKSMEYRLASGRSAIRHRMIQQRIANETGLPASVGSSRIAPDMGLQAEHVADSQKAQEILQGTHGQDVQGPEWINQISNIGRDTLVGANPVPHAKNIASLAYISGGVPVIKRGLEYAMSGVPKALKDRLEKYGAGTHFMLSNVSSVSPVKVLPWRKSSSMALDRIDMGMRAARLQQIDKQFPHLSEYEKAQKVNEDIGAYKDSPAYVQMTKWVGAQFPQWHAYIVPTTIARGILRNPQRVETIVRGTNAVNNDVVGDKAGYKIDPGGPVSEAANLYADPLRVANLPYAELPKAILSPSSAGVVGGLTQLTHKAGEGTSPLDPQGALGQIIPYLSIIAPQLGINRFNSKAPADVRSVAAFFAAYPKAEQSVRESMVRGFIEHGMSRFKAEQQTQRVFSRLRRYMK